MEREQITSITETSIMENIKEESLMVLEFIPGLMVALMKVTLRMA
jgi:hypothetical protein